MTSTMEPVGHAVRAPVTTPLERLLREFHARYRNLNEGTVADYIPELSRADPGWFGISIVTLDGHEYSAGDTEVAFTIQSISKPFVYGQALEDNGEESVLSRVGVEPSGDAFNAISLDPGTGVPSNPMINAGAIATAAMVKPGTSDALTRVMATFGRYTGHAMAVDEAVYLSESETGHRNRAIGHLLRNFNIILDDPEAALDLYFRQCSISVTCRDLAVMASCLANGGVNPITRERAIDRRYVESILSVMGSCGMYDYAGEWIYRVGMPAKSGVSGGVLAVLPGQLGIGVFSPRLDRRGNSVRGVRVCADLSRSYSLHMLSVPNLGRSPVRVSYDVTTVRSKRQRRREAAELLSRFGSKVRVYELQGDLAFASVEAFARQIATAFDSLEIVVIDFKHTARIDDGGLALMADLFRSLLGGGKRVALSHTGRIPESIATMAVLNATEELALFADKDSALEWSEDRVLESVGPPLPEERVPLAENELCEGLDARSVAGLESVARRMCFSAGEAILRAGDPGESLYLLAEGTVSIMIDHTSGGGTRIATLSPGMTFGEMAVLGEPVRSANVIADTDAECYVIGVQDLAELGRADPGLRATLYENLARKLAANLRQANTEVRALSG